MAIYIAKPVIDSYMDGESPDANHGAGGGLYLGTAYVGGDKSGDWRVIGNFDVSALAGRTVNAAALWRWHSGWVGLPFDAKVYRCTRPSTWTSGGVTWNKYDGVNDWTAVGGDFDLTTPTPLLWSENNLTPRPKVVTGFGGFVTDALSLRSGIVSLIIKPDDSAPGVDRWSACRSTEGHGFGGSWRWQLVVDHSGDPIGMRRGRRGFLRDALRGVMRGGL